MQKTLVFIVPHTHWDREWYLTAEEFRFFLCKALDEVLHLLDSNKKYKFTLDGQLLPLLDYLELRPEMQAKIQKLVQTRRLCIGPWFSQPDEFLVSGEALLRNLLFGIDIARKFGGAMLHGYIPDAFGHIAQLPQILRGFEIDTAFVMRGAEKAAQALASNEFLWVGPDGTAVACHVLETGYCNAADFTFENLNKWLLRFRRLTSKDKDLSIPGVLQSLAERSRTRAVLLLHGCDHRGPEKLLFTTIKKLSKTLPQYDFVIATIEEYANVLKKVLNNKNAPRVCGELRKSLRHPILPGVLSTRIYLKQAENVVETLIEKYAEPLAGLAMLRNHDFQSFLRRAWSLLLQNNAHDSICGTGIDEVHQEMMRRFAQVRSLANFIIEGALTALGKSLASEKTGNGSVLVFNPLPWSQVAEVEVYLKDIKANYLQASDGKLIPLRIEHHRDIQRCENILQGVEVVEKRAIVFQDEFPPFGIKTYRLVPKADKKARFTTLCTTNALENEFYKLQVYEDGTFDILDKETELEFRGLHVFEDVADRGDEYTFDPLPNDRTVTSQGLKGRIRPKQIAPWKAAIIVTLKLPLPASLTRGRAERSKRTVSLPVRIMFSLQSHVKRVDISTELTNNAKDHRLRIVFPTGLEQPNIVVDKTFAVLDYKLPQPSHEEWEVEQPVPTIPQKLFVALEKNGQGFAIINRGLPECEVTEDGKICLTLLRAVGWLSRDDLHARKGHAGPPLPTPGAQCDGTHVFNYALYSYKGAWYSSGLLTAALAFLAPPVGLELPSLPLTKRSFISLDREEIVMSACKPAEDGRGIVVRFYNACGKSVQVRIRVELPVKEVWLVRLDETHVVPIRSDSGVIELMFDRWQIKTLKFIF
ncbi:MAG: glycoside hydrolase family 38 C-terminal domain-containing protein [Candidatus Hadarchaeum sp.]|uniref:alpha-mannosidase n=1 Tax=Candidatus Hadarchaeum sp. TaxID=2883567 RepID=UPI00318297FA